MFIDLALEHLMLRLRPLNRTLRAAVRRQAEQAARLTRPDITHMCITDEQVNVLLEAADCLLEGQPAATVVSGMSESERSQQETLRAEAAAVGAELPLDALARLQNLTAFEQDALLLCAAPEIDRGYGRIFGYVLDDMNRRNPCVELLSALNAATLNERLLTARALGPHGRLRRTGMLRVWGEAANQLRQELRLGSGMLDCLCGARSPATFQDAAEVTLEAAPVDGDRAEEISRLGLGLRQGTVAIIGVWGPVRGGHAEIAHGLALAAGRPLRRFVAGADAQVAVRSAIDAAEALGAVLWIGADALADDAGTAMREQISQALASSSVPAVLTGVVAWRPLPLLAIRAYAEMRIAAPGHDERQQLWSRALPGAAPEQLAALAGRYRVGGAEIRAVALATRTSTQTADDDLAADITQHVDAACASVLRPASQRHVILIEPRRGPDDLILPPALHRQVMEVADFFRAWPKVAEQWGFGRLMSGRGGIKALFSGDSGTGKTLAAEVVAGALGMPLLKIDLSQIVSKWVGETEKHLEEVFTEAEDSHGVLFFDEADALFGKRGDVQYGVDRYANLEVSYLLQRIEDYAGLVILASNLKDNIDSAFMRRFQVVIQFPRPQPKERRRIWEIAFPESSLDEGVDLDVLARLDLTGAGITAAARTAALIAAVDGRDAIGKSHVVSAIARQYRLEARVLIPADLGTYAGLMKDVT